MSKGYVGECYKILGEAMLAEGLLEGVDPGKIMLEERDGTLAFRLYQGIPSHTIKDAALCYMVCAVNERMGDIVNEAIRKAKEEQAANHERLRESEL